ncbi:MAG: hypothetical protein WAM78_14375 [Candidatus Sulfotelmatobacter sp.]
MKLTKPWTTYRTRFLVKAKQLTSSLTFTDSLGRLHSGRKGDYLVESSDGVLRIAPRQIFEDIYVPLFATDKLSTELNAGRPNAGRLDNESLGMENLGADELDAGTETSEPSAPFSLPFPITRKSPQPYRDRRNLSPGLRSL